MTVIEKARLALPPELAAVMVCVVAFSAAVGVPEILQAAERLSPAGKDGDGVIGRIVSSRAGVVWKAEVPAAGSASSSVTKLEVKAGAVAEEVVVLRLR